MGLRHVGCALVYFYCSTFISLEPCTSLNPNGYFPMVAIQEDPRTPGMPVRRCDNRKHVVGKILPKIAVDLGDFYLSERRLPPLYVAALLGSRET